MSRKNPFRDLLKSAPTSEEIEVIVERLYLASDFEAVIIGTAILDTALERLIKAKLKRRDKDFVDRLFGFRGILGTFDAKLTAAEAFGFITKPIAKEIGVLKDLRNAFAHSRYPIQLTDDLVAKEVVALTMVTAVRNASPEGHAFRSLAPKRLFVLTVRLLLIGLEEFAKSHEFEPDRILQSALEKHDQRQRS